MSTKEHKIVEHESGQQLKVPTMHAKTTRRPLPAVQGMRAGTFAHRASEAEMEAWSRNILINGDLRVQVPFRRIHLTNGEHYDAYDTSGPEVCAKATTLVPRQ